MGTSNKKTIILRNLGISYLKRIFRIIKGPVFASLFFTRKCNYDCYYCNTSKGHVNSDISIKHWKNIVNQIYNEGCRHIAIYGGEPTLRSDLNELLRHCIDLGIFTHLVTNGSLLSKDLLDDFATYGYFLLGISVDTVNNAPYTPKRFNPQLFKLLREIQIKYPNNLDFCIHIINTNENIKDLIPLIKLIKETLDCRFSIDPVHSSMAPKEQYHYRSYCPELLLEKSSMGKLGKVILNLKKQGVQIMSPNNYYYYMNKWYNNQYSWKCDAGDLYYAIDNDGTIMLCEEVKSPIKFNDFLNLPYKLRVKKLNAYKFEYCDCFKPCYWNPTSVVRNPLKNFLFKFRFR
ncbi:MAG: radical SAM protein [Promethearchaeota archaeon]